MDYKGFIYITLTHEFHLLQLRIEMHDPQFFFSADWSKTNVENVDMHIYNPLNNFFGLSLENK